IDVRAAIAFEPGKPLSIETVQLDGPHPGEVLVELKATGVCHTDEFTLSGADPEGLFPAILGHEGAGVVVEVGEGVKSVEPGDHVIPLYTPECRECEFCLNPKTNLCQKIRATQGQAVMPDGTSRFSLNGKKPRQRLRRRPRPDRRSEDRRLVHGGEDQHRRPDHPHHATGADQRSPRSHAPRKVDPQRRVVLRQSVYPRVRGEHAIRHPTGAPPAAIRPDPGSTWRLSEKTRT